MLHRMKTNIAHTRIKRTTTITNIRYDQYNPMTLIVDFQHTIPTKYYINENQIIYAIYLDRTFVKEFFEKSTKFQLSTINVNFGLEVFAHPHGGFQFIRNRLSPGNKIRIQFQAKNPNQFDVASHKVYFDDGLGTINILMGAIDAKTGTVSGSLLLQGSVQ